MLQEKLKELAEEYELSGNYHVALVLQILLEVVQSEDDPMLYRFTRECQQSIYRMRQEFECEQGE